MHRLDHIRARPGEPRCTATLKRERCIRPVHEGRSHVYVALLGDEEPNDEAAYGDLAENLKEK